MTPLLRDGQSRHSLMCLSQWSIWCQSEWVRLVISSVVVMLTAAAIGCGGSSIEPSPDGQVRVAGSVLDFQSSAAVGGAHVNIGRATATTDPSGVYSLTVPVGEYQVSIDGESIGFVKMVDRTYRGDFYVHITGCVARYGTVLDRQRSRPVSGASVSLSGVTVMTDRTGWFQLTLGCAGAACVGFGTTILSITHRDYVSGSFVAGRGVCFVQRVDYDLTPR
jgi:hypothetical protein